MTKKEIHVRSIFLQGLLLAETQNTIPKKFSEHVALRNFNIWCQKNSLSKREVCLFDISIKNENKVLGFENKSQIQSFNRFSRVKREIKYPDFLKTSDLTLLDPRNW